jgi:hypothetical protein
VKQHTNGNNVDFAAIRGSPAFAKFCLKTTKLQKISFQSMNEKERLVFFVNIYNTIYMHGYSLFGVPLSSLERKTLQQKGYNIDGRLFSLDIIDLILKGNNPFLPIICLVSKRLSF